MRRILAWSFQLLAMIGDLICIGAIIFIAVKVNLLLGFIAFYATHLTQQQLGGWFFSWKKENREKFFAYIDNQ